MVDVESGDFLLRQENADLNLSFAETTNDSINLIENTAKFSNVQDIRQEMTLTHSMIIRGLSVLGHTSSSTSVTYLQLSLTNKLLWDINLISTFAHLKYLDLSHNKLKDLSPLSNLHHLTVVNVSHNRITDMMCFIPSFNLQTIDFSYNEIEEFPEQMDQFSSLTKLVMDGNQLTSLSGLNVLVCLTFLSLSDNRLENINGLNNLPIKTLILAGNSITTITGIYSLRLLEVINLSNNQITSLEGLSGFDYLNEINLEENQIVEFKEIYHLEELHQLTDLNLRKNPIQNDASYKQFVLVTLKRLLCLDKLNIHHHEKVSAKNRYSPSTDLLASQNHMENVVKAIKKQARLNFSTLTQPDEPYPMLVLCGPPGSGKEFYAQQLVEEFPSFFGLGVSHTTRPQGVDESHGRDYYFINDTTFKRAADAGEFIQTCFKAGQWYGLTMAAIEQVAQQGLACVCHLSLEGVLSLKRCHFEPRYILLLPLNKQIHDERIRSSDQSSIGHIDKYLDIHLTRPGFFDATINTDKLNEGYNILRTIVMAYGGISPDTPLTLSLSASRPTTRQTSSSLSSYDINIDDDEDDTSKPNTAIATKPHLLNEGNLSMSRSAPVTTAYKDVSTEVYTRECHQQLNALAQSWSRPSTSQSDTRSIKENGLSAIKRSVSDESAGIMPQGKEIIEN